jgi:uncharacterized protein
MKFVIFTENVENTKKFYNEVFGWKIKLIKVGIYIKYWLLISEKNGKKETEGFIAQKFEEYETTTMLINVPSIKEYIWKMISTGGGTISAIECITGLGYFAICEDSNNNIFGIWENNKNAKCYEEKLKLIK